MAEKWVKRPARVAVEVVADDADGVQLALRYELGQSTDGVLDGRVRIDPVLVEQVDVVGAQPLEGNLD